MSIQQDVGRLEGQVESIKTTCESLENSIRDLRTDLHALQRILENTISQGKGGWRVLSLLGGVAGVMGGAAAWIVSHWKGIP